MHFTAKDSDNDAYGGGNCALVQEGAWWFNDCYHSDLSGVFYTLHVLGISFNIGL